MLFKFLIVRIEVSKLIREDIGVRNKVKVLFAKLLLHAHHVETKTVLPCNLVTLGEVVYLLELIQTLVRFRK